MGLIMELLQNLNLWIFYSGVLSLGIIYLTYIIFTKDRDDLEYQNDVVQELFNLDEMTKQECLDSIKQCNEAIEVLKDKKSRCSFKLASFRNNEK